MLSYGSLKKRVAQRLKTLIKQTVNLASSRDEVGLSYICLGQVRP